MKITHLNTKTLQDVKKSELFDYYNLNAKHEKPFIDLTAIKKDLLEKVITSEQAKDVILTYYAKQLKSGNDGAGGRGFETAFKHSLADTLGFANVAGFTDFVVKRGVAVELKTGGGWLTPYNFATKEQALEYFNSTSYPMKKATHVAYLSRFTGSNELDAGIFSQPAFIALLKELKLIRVKAHGRKGSYTYGVAIQSFTHNPSKWIELDLAVQSLGEEPVRFYERMID